jgi:hypothetical protein
MRFFVFLLSCLPWFAGCSDRDVFPLVTDTGPSQSTEAGTFETSGDQTSTLLQNADSGTGTPSQYETLSSSDAATFEDSSSPGTQGQQIRISGTLRYEDGTAYSQKAFRVLLILSGERLFASQLDHHMEGSLTFEAVTDRDGGFSYLFPFAEFSALVDSECRISASWISQASNLTVSIAADADSDSCKNYCAASKPSDSNCASSCLSGGRKLVGRASLEATQLIDLESQASADDRVTLPLDMKLRSLSASISETQGADLRVDAQAIADSVIVVTRNIRSTSCALVEGCVGGAGDRKLLKFDGVIQNLGSEDFVIGDPTNSPELFTYSDCHGHFHLNEAMFYELLDPITRESVYAEGRRVTGHKQGFCMIDMEQVAGKNKAKFTCTYQGLTAGWSDIYARGLDCQWVDVTGVPPGNYLLRVTVNPSGSLPESDKTNNSVEVPVTLTE